MQTAHCVRAVFTGLAGVPGIELAEVERGTALIDHDGRATADAIVDAIRIAGYEVRSVRDERRQLPVL